MARRSFEVRDVTEILVHWDAGRSQSEIADSLGMDRKTVKKYLAPARAAGMAPGSGRSQAEWSVLVRDWFPHLADTSLRQFSWPLIEPHRDYIVAQLEAGVTKATIHQRLRDEAGLTASVASVKRWIAANLPEQALRAKVTVLGQDPPPGQEAQIDYGYLGMWADPRGGARRRVWGFVMVLCCSRHLFLRPVLRMDQQAWTQCHVEAFEFFGGTPARLVPDNLKTGVVKADLYDPLLNRSYAELAAHYGVLIDPARAGKPKDKSNCRLRHDHHHPAHHAHAQRRLPPRTRRRPTTNLTHRQHRPTTTPTRSPANPIGPVCRVLLGALMPPHSARYAAK